MKQEVAQVLEVPQHGAREAYQGSAAAAQGIAGGRRLLGQAAPAFRQEVADHGPDQTAHHLVDQPGPLETRIAPLQRRQALAGQRDLAQVRQIEEPGPKPVVDVVVGVGDVVGQGRHLGFRRGMAGQFQVEGVVERGHAGQGPLQRPVVLARPSRLSQVRFRPSKAA